MTEFQFLQVDPGAKDKTKTKLRDQSKKMVLKLELGSSKITLKNSRHILE